MRNFARVLAVTVALHATGTSATTTVVVRPELANVGPLSVTVDVWNLPGFDPKAVGASAEQILEKNGIAVRHAANPQDLFVRINHWPTGCKGRVAIRATVLLAEDAPVKRSSTTRTVRVTTWQREAEEIVPESKGAETARRLALDLVSGFASSAAYATANTKRK